MRPWKRPTPCPEMQRRRPPPAWRGPSCVCGGRTRPGGPRVRVSYPPRLTSSLAPGRRVASGRTMPRGGVRVDPLHPPGRHPCLEHRPTRTVLPGHQHMRGRPPAGHRVHVRPIRQTHPHHRFTPIAGRGHLSRRAKGRPLVHANAHAPTPPRVPLALAGGCRRPPHPRARGAPLDPRCAPRQGRAPGPPLRPAPSLRFGRGALRSGRGRHANRPGEREPGCCRAHRRVWPGKEAQEEATEGRSSSFTEARTGA